MTVKKYYMNKRRDVKNYIQEKEYKELYKKNVKNQLYMNKKRTSIKTCI